MKKAKYPIDNGSDINKILGEALFFFDCGDLGERKN